mgnify:CR=1 FL=1
MSVKLVMFDLGGVLVHIAPQRFLTKVAEATGKPVEALKPSLEDRKLIEALELGRINPRKFYEQVNERTGVNWTYEQFVTAWPQYEDMVRRIPRGWAYADEPAHTFRPTRVAGG